MTDPFSLSDDEKIVILLARALYLRGCIFKSEKPVDDIWYTGPRVLRQNAEQIVDLIGFDPEVIPSVIDECGRLYKEAYDKHTTTTAAPAA